MSNIPDHPVVDHLLKWGTPDDSYDDYEQEPCPACGETEYYDLFLDRYGDVIGCNHCIRRVDANDYWSE